MYKKNSSAEGSTIEKIIFIFLFLFACVASYFIMVALRPLFGFNEKLLDTDFIGVILFPAIENILS